MTTDASRLIPRLPRINGWTIAVWLIALLVASPILVVLGSVLSPSEGVFSHLASTVLSQYITHSLMLMVGVGVGVLILGIGTAWLVTMCRFPGSRLFEWALLLPLAAPAYLLAYTYTDWLDYYGPVQLWLRSQFGWQSVNDYWFPDVRSVGGAIAMFSLTLYPYVYMLARVAFLEQSVCTLEASRSLGCGPWRSFFRVALPLARPAIIAGLSLALMETLSDFGTVDYFGVATFTTGIYRTWFGMGAQVAAAQLSAMLMVFILVLIVLERWSRRQAKYYQAKNSTQRPQPYSLSGIRALGAVFACGLPITLGLLLPGSLLAHMTLTNLDETLDNRFVELAQHSLILAGLTAGIGIVVALVLGYGARLSKQPLVDMGVRLASMGYAVPGAVIAVGILIPVVKLDKGLSTWIEAATGNSVGLLLSGTITALIFAYLVRFLAVALGTVESGLGKIRPTIDDAARSLGCSPTKTLVKIHTPLMASSLLTALMLVFVDVMKELPATLVMRPFNFDTLAVRVYQYASDERLVEASAPALMILLVGLIPVILLSWRIARER
ncbi:iron ABC transporter permease [Leptolyngbya cf. ectocarpi LEGE 11479]|uniref:Iron ABC transporter permease n=1 Tax=Leptolyngbya cf. ectocarpi LEGE 11479 TaxID=1828722 RepID=A0A929F7E6_LEPEC|nr:iron ABC transporter permease [Leptolyngbya ectocarpi]MBE9068705.1 iron ABC transporter permease [Leptolyngbya cf. ectocarpi LEGE 11479]